MSTDEWLSLIGLPEYAAAFNANHVAMDTFASLSADDLKEMGVASLGHRKRILEEIAKLSWLEPEKPGVSEQAVKHPPLEGGMWFNQLGSSFSIPHSLEHPNPPMFVLSSSIDQITRQQPNISVWITKHYPKNKIALDEFWSNLRVMMMTEEGWWFAWRGVICGCMPSVGMLRCYLRLVMKAVNDLNWPLDAIVTLVDMQTRQEEECIWRQLISPPALTDFD